MRHLVFILFYFAANLAFAQNTLLTGKVYNESNSEPMSKVEIFVLKDSAIYFKAITDSTGKYYFNNLEPGYYTANIKLEGFYNRKFIQIPMTQNKFTILDISLKPVVFEYNSCNPVIYGMWDPKEWTITVDSLCNVIIINKLSNKKDSEGKKQGIWYDVFMDYKDTSSGYEIGDLINKGHYKNDLKHGEWIYWKPNAEIEKIETYKNGKLKKVKTKGFKYKDYL